MNRMSDVSIKGMFDDLQCDIDCEALRFGVDFVKSLKEFYQKNGFLTEKQEASLRKIYRTHMGE
jgi:hypothetical protein